MTIITFKVYAHELYVFIFPFAVVSPSDSDFSHSTVSSPIQPHPLHTPYGLAAPHSAATGGSASSKQSSDWTLMKLVRTATVTLHVIAITMYIVQCRRHSIFIFAVDFYYSTVNSGFHLISHSV